MADDKDTVPLKFAEAFPSIATLNIVVDERPASGGDVWHGTFDLASPPGLFIRCHNPRCHRGGFNIGDVLSDMVSQRVIERKIHLLCPGDEGSPEGEHGPHCLRTANIVIQITFHKALAIEDVTPPENAV